MRVLIAVPAKRDRMEVVARESVLTQRWKDGSPVDTVFLVDGRIEQPWFNLLAKLQQARKLALEGGYDALLTVYSDMILPDDALESLWSIDAPVAYGLFMDGGQWNVYLGDSPPLSASNVNARFAWGKVIECVGYGQAVCLIRREVLEAIDFRNDAIRLSDQAVDFSLDCQELGFTQMCHLGVVCGHIDYIEGHQVIYWPDANAPDLYRTSDWGDYRGG